MDIEHNSYLPIVNKKKKIVKNLVKFFFIDIRFTVEDHPYAYIH